MSPSTLRWKSSSTSAWLTPQVSMICRSRQLTGAHATMPAQSLPKAPQESILTWFCSSAKLGQTFRISTFWQSSVMLSRISPFRILLLSSRLLTKIAKWMRNTLNSGLTCWLRVLKICLRFQRNVCSYLKEETKDNRRPLPQKNFSFGSPRCCHLPASTPSPSPSTMMTS